MSSTSPIKHAFGAIPLCWLVLVGCTGNREITQLTADLQADARDTRYDAAKQIEDCIEQGFDASTAVPSLAAALSDEDRKVRYRAAKSLAKLGKSASPAIVELSEALVDPKNNERMRYYVAKSIYKLGNERILATQQLMRAMKDSNSDVVCYAVKSLGKIGPPAEASLGMLKKLARSDNSKVRAVARDAIEKIKDKGAD